MEQVLYCQSRGRSRMSVFTVDVVKGFTSARTDNNTTTGWPGCPDSFDSECMYIMSATNLTVAVEEDLLVS